MNNLLAICLLGILIGAPTVSAAAPAEQSGQGGLELSGSMYADCGMLHDLRENQKDKLDFLGTAVFAAQFRTVNRKHAKVEGDFELILPYGTAAEWYIFALRSNETDSTAQQLRQTASRYYELYGMEKTLFLLDMRKLYLEFYLPFADVAAGRQIINFGKGFLFSPIDAFSSAQISDINFRRNGSDVANIRIPFGDLAGVDCIVEAPIGDREHSSAMKLFGTIVGWDLSCVGLYHHKSREAVAGAAFKGDAFAGVYGELVEHFVDGFDKQYFECMLGADYSINNVWFFNAEYYYKDGPKTPLSLWGCNNAYASIQFSPNELTRFSIIGCYQFEAQSAIGMLSWYYSLFQNTDLFAYVRGYRHLQSIGAPDFQYSMRVEVKF